MRPSTSNGGVDDFNQVRLWYFIYNYSIWQFYFISSLLYMEEFLLPQNKPILLVFEDTTNSKHRFHHFLYKDQNHNIGDIQNEDNYSPVGTFLSNLNWQKVSGLISD